MKTIKEKKNLLSIPSLFRKVCVILVWITVLYSSVIQYKAPISNGMLVLGLLVLGTFMLSQTGKGLDFKEVFTKESKWMLAFMIYMLPVGFVVAPVSSSHLSQWITSSEYLLMMIIVSSLIMSYGMESFHLLLLVIGVSLVFFLIQSPVKYFGTDRLSLSDDLNPNGLGMCFAGAIWAILYFQQKKKASFVISFGLVALLCYGIILTGSRKALIATGIIVTVWYFFCFLSKKDKERNKWRPLIIFGSFLLVGAFGLLFLRLYAGSDMASRIEDLENETISGSRVNMYTQGWKLFCEHPLFGLGFQGFQHFFGYYSHATFTEVPVSGGILGSILYFAAYYISIKKIIRLFGFCKNECKLSYEFGEIKMLLGMWAAMLFYCTCIIHPYQFDSYFVFGIIFGQSAYIERRVLTLQTEQRGTQRGKCKWIR